MTTREKAITLPLDMVETLLLIADSVGGLSDQCKLAVAEVRREVDQVKRLAGAQPDTALPATR